MMIPPIVGRARLLVVALGPSSRMFWPNSLQPQERDELRAQEDADEQRGGAADEDLAHQAVCAAARRRRPRARRRASLDEDGVRRLEQLGQQRRGLGGVGDRVVAVHRGGARADGDEQSTPRSRA
jgi:hypothetical protein